MDYGIKITKEGVNAEAIPTETNKKDFQLISTNECLLKKESSSSPSNTNRFLGYRLTNSNTRANPLNHWDGTAVYIIYENPM